MLVKKTHNKLDNLTLLMALSAVETFTISEENWIKNVLIRIIPTKGCEQNNNNQLESLNSPGKGLHQQEKLSQFQKKIAYKRIMDCVNKNKEHCFIF